MLLGSSALSLPEIYCIIYDMKASHILFAAVLGAATAFAQAVPECSYTMNVGNSSAEQSVSKGAGKSSGGRRSRSSVSTKTTSRSMSWPVSVSVRGKSLPPAGAIKLKCRFVGTTDGRAEFLGDNTIPVVLDEKGVFKTEVTSPTEKLVRTTTKTRTRGGRRGGRGMSTKSETTGTRITGCIIQLLVNGKVEKSFASHPGWRKFAKQTPLPEAEILKIR